MGKVDDVGFFIRFNNLASSPKGELLASRDPALDPLFRSKHPGFGSLIAKSVEVMYMKPNSQNFLLR